MSAFSPLGMVTIALGIPDLLLGHTDPPVITTHVGDTVEIVVVVMIKVEVDTRLMEKEKALPSAGEGNPESTKSSMLFTHS